METVLEDRDPRRNKPLVDWILSLQLEIQGDSAFAGILTLTVVSQYSHVLSYQIIECCGRVNGCHGGSI